MRKFIVLTVLVGLMLMGATTVLVDSVSKAKTANIGNALVTDTVLIQNGLYKSAWIGLGVGSYGTTMSSDSAVTFTVEIKPYFHSLSDTLGGGNIYSTDYVCATGAKLDTTFTDTLISPNIVANALTSIYQRFIITVKNKQVDKSDSDSAGVKVYLFKEPR